MSRRRKDTAIESVFQALADRTRRQMVERVSQSPVTVSELARPFSITLAAAVQHVQVLERSGLVRTEKQGRVRLVMVDPVGLSALRQWLDERRNLWETRLDGLSAILREKPKR